MLDREQSSIISWPRIPLPQDSQDFLPVETAKVTFHFRFFPLLLHERNPETTSQSKNSRAKTIAPQPRPTAVSSHSGFMARARRTTGREQIFLLRFLVHGLSLAMFLATQRNLSRKSWSVFARPTCLSRETSYLFRYLIALFLFLIGPSTVSMPRNAKVALFPFLVFYFYSLKNKRKIVAPFSSG